ncbi:hypothetical protein [Candidatus Parabeggiatoa sp. HSG14]|uniref:hypothetical protein n=1 Tax=Candidatus Parabeggiatoa sp. HSG14 TaxID=3055593 RepID=UPI0025A8A413|nr:hypothetical protein [Thiotrichales bacterium HSG14]
MKLNDLKNSATEKREDSHFAQQIDAAILSGNNNFIVQALLSDDTRLMEMTHRKVHSFCDAHSFCYS